MEAVVQAMKAGIMEMADIYVINKPDLRGAEKMAADIKRIASLARIQRLLRYRWPGSSYVRM